jgi:C4-dicarboxylate transporter DctM subunit
VLTGRVLVIVFTAYAFGRLLTEYRIPIMIADWILAFTNQVYVVCVLRRRPAHLPGHVHGDAGHHPAGHPRAPAGHDGLRRGSHPLRRDHDLLRLGRLFDAASGREHVHRLGNIEQVPRTDRRQGLPFVLLHILVIALLIIFPDLVLYLPSLIDVSLQ